MEESGKKRGKEAREGGKGRRLVQEKDSAIALLKSQSAWYYITSLTLLSSVADQLFSTNSSPRNTVDLAIHENSSAKLFKLLLILYPYLLISVLYWVGQIQCSFEFLITSRSITCNPQSKCTYFPASGMCWQVCRPALEPVCGTFNWLTL